MRFQSEEITKAIEELMIHENLQSIFLLTKDSLKKSSVANDPVKMAELDRKMNTKYDRITANKEYLRSLLSRIKESQSEESLLALLHEVENIEIKAGFVRQRLVPSLKKPPTIIIGTELEGFNTVNQHLQKIREVLTIYLKSVQTVKNMNHTKTVGTLDANQKITSQSIQEFTEKSLATNHESFPENKPTALVDFRRNITVNHVKFPKSITSDELKKSLMEFLNTSEQIQRSPPIIREALCNAMLKNGQALQTVFTYEFKYGPPCITPLTLGNEQCLIAQTEANFNWTLNEKGALTVNVELDIKSVILPSNPKGFPLVIDRKTGEIREFDPEREKIGQCPTLLKYQSSISFDTTTKVHEEAGKEPVTETVAMPHVNDYTVTLFHDSFRYTPTLTAFDQLETNPKQPVEAPASSNK